MHTSKILVITLWMFSPLASIHAEAGEFAFFECDTNAVLQCQANNRSAESEARLAAKNLQPVIDSLRSQKSSLEENLAAQQATIDVENKNIQRLQAELSPKKELAGEKEVLPGLSAADLFGLAVSQRSWLNRYPEDYTQTLSEELHRLTSLKQQKQADFDYTDSEIKRLENQIKEVLTQQQARITDAESNAGMVSVGCVRDFCTR